MKARGWMWVAAAGFALVARAEAQSNVGVVDIARIFEQYERTGYLEEEFLAKKKFLSDEAEKRRGQIESSRKALQDAYKPGTPDFQQKSDEVREAEVRFEVWSRREEDGLLNSHKESLLHIYNDVRESVKKVAQQRGVQLVVTYDMLTQDAPDSKTMRQQILLQKVIYWDPTIDLTDDVLKILNDDFRKGPGNPGAAAKPAKDAAAKDSPPKDGAKPQPPAGGQKPASGKPEPKKPEPKQP